MFSPSVTRRLIEEFSRRPRPEESSPAPADLTPREIQVLRLLARGLSNPEIAERLVVSEHTTKTHVTHILRKLGLRDRTRPWCWPTSPGSSRRACPESARRGLR
jgi:DNA-binding NarL/FixJ family response regulator